MQQIAATADTVRDLATQHLERNVANRVIAPNKTYEGEWKRYKDWVLRGRANNVIPPGAKFIAIPNVELYFNQVVVTRAITAPSARRILSALQWWSDNLEHVLPKLKLNTESVQIALEVQLQKEKDRKRKSYKDPHFDLPTNVLTQHECTQLVQAALRMKCWRSLSTTFTGCCNVFTRMDSYLKFSLADLVLCPAHGPKSNNGSGNMDCYAFGYILQARTHKDNSFDKRVTGSWRHREYIRCATGMLAFNLFTRLHDNNSIHFISSNNNNAPPEWHLIPLVDSWESERTADTAYRSLYKKTGISWGKITHLRKQGMEYASSRGELMNHAVAGLSKHDIGKVARYVTELPPATLRVMAGFKVDEEYFVPRTQLSMMNNMTKEEVTRAIFPKIDDWRDERESHAGDKGPAAKSFLYDVLPYLAMVVVQDGIHWVHDYPEHEASRLLLHAMPNGYDTWARASQRECIHMINTRDASRISDLNIASQAAFDNICQTLQTFDSKVSENHKFVTEKLNENDSNIAAILNNQKLIFNELKSMKGLMHTLINTVQNNSGGAGTCGVITAAANNDEDTATFGMEIDGDDNKESNSVNCTISQLSVGTRQLEYNKAHDVSAGVRTVDQALRRTPQQPAFPDALPKTFSEILQQHRTFELSRYKHTTKTFWEKKRQVAFSRRWCLYEEIKEKACSYKDNNDFEKNKMPRAAIALDKELEQKNISIDKYRKEFLVKKRGPRK
jgi:Centromere DNA-binding protein complex CBF3 subunit, domain 2